jgi:hypothetical protein
MSLRQQQIAVFFGTVVVIFSILPGSFAIAQRLTTRGNSPNRRFNGSPGRDRLLADSPRQRPAPQGRVVQSQPSSPLSFLGNIFPGVGSKPKTHYIPAPRHAMPKSKD